MICHTILHGSSERSSTLKSACALPFDSLEQALVFLAYSIALQLRGATLTPIKD